MDGIVDAVDELAGVGRGDVLVFLPGEREIREAAEALRKHHPPATEILPLFARLSVEDQERVFRPGGGRRIVLATNVAETSLTVPGIRYVVDTGLARVKRYSYRNKVEQLQIEPVSQAAANQRAGRCGRVAERRLHPALRRGRLREAAALHRPRGAALVARERDPAHEVAAASATSSEFPFVEPPPGTRDRRRLPAARRTERGRRPQRAHRDRPRAGEAAARPAHRPHAAGGARPAVPARDARHRVGAVGAGPARAPARGAGGGRPGAPPARRRQERLPVAGEAVELRAGEDRAQEVEPQAHRRPEEPLPRPRRVREWIDVHGQLATIAREHGLARQRRAGDLRAAAPRAARRPARQRRHAHPRRRPRRAAVRRRARHQVPRLAGLAAAEEGGALGDGGRARRDVAPVRAHHREHRARVARARRRAPAEEVPHRSALGEEGRAGDGLRARDAVRPRRLRAAPRAVRAA